MRVLIVEDDAALGQFLAQGLRLDGHEIEIAADGEAALIAASRMQPELMILDLGLPLKDGLSVLEEMTAHSRSTTVLVLSARAGLEERVKCLGLGADDVVCKPFSFYELRARVRALERRQDELGERVLRFGALEMDRAQRRVTMAGAEVALTATEFSLLESLLRRRGERVCSRSELLREVWRMPQGVVEGGGGANIVEVYINYLRKKLSRTHGPANSCSVIRTIRGKGYLLDPAMAGEGMVAHG